MLCTISGQVPVDPVVSRVNGCLYERRLIEKYIAEHHRCPKTNEPMTRDDLITVSTGGNGAQTQPTSIPAVLQLLHNEWDALMLEQFSLRQQLSQTQQELSHALYQHDAACRVIAKLMKEKDELRSQLNAALGKADDEAADEEEDETKPVLPPSIVEDIDEWTRRLRTTRKSKEVPRSLLPAGQLANIVEQDTAQVHSDRGGNVAVHCVSVHESNNNKLVYSGGADGKAVCYDANRKAVAATLIGHTKAIRQVRAFQDSVVTCSDDGTTRFWRNNGGTYQASVIRGHQGAVTGFAAMPSMKNIVTCGTDGCLIFSDLQTGAKVATGRSAESTLGMNSVELHPDGYFAATGSANKVLIWDLKHMEVQHALHHETDGAVTGVCFNPLDAFKLAVSTTRGIIKVWDLRKTDAAPHTITFDDSPPSQPIAVSGIKFDDAGQYLAAATNTVKIWDMKQNTLLTSLPNHLEPVTDIAWGKDAQWLASSSLDRTVRIYGNV